MHRQPRLNPFHVALLYGAIAVSWIVVSDGLLQRLGLPTHLTFLIGITKSALFVAVTMLAFYLTLRTMVTQIAKAQSDHQSDLRDSEERFTKAFGSNPEGMTISTLGSGEYVEANDAFVAMMGYRHDELIGNTSSDLGIWADASERVRLLALLREGKPVQGCRTFFRNKSGNLIEVEVSAERIQLGGRPCLLAITRDVSQQRRLERQFQQAQRMEAVGQLAAGVAHDFRNQLMLIGGYADLLEVSDENNCKRRSQILSAVQKCESLTQQLLAYSRKQESRPEVLNLSLALLEVSKMLPNLLGKKIETGTSLDSDWNIYADPGQLEQVLINLAVNARDAMPKGGRFRIATSNLAVPVALDKPGGLVVPEGEYVQLMVSDTGHGIPEEVCARIFEPFFTTKEKGKGTGLGLAAVYGIVKQSNGYIFVDSQVDVGTTFQIIFPRLLNLAELAPEMVSPKHR